MKKPAIVLVTILLLSFHAAVAQDAEDRARFAAEQWIVLVDDGQFDESWKEAAKLFQDSVSQEDWEKKAAANHELMGPKDFRKLKDIKSTGSVKGLPAGQYVLVKYQSSYAKKKTATETITAVMEPDGKWRVAAYSIN